MTPAAQTEHLSALIFRLHNERARLAAAPQKERALRSVWVSQCEREINDAERFFGVSETDFSAPQMSDAELLAELMA